MPKTQGMLGRAGVASRREAILAAALASFVRIGYSNTTIEDIRRASGASVGSLYHHFGGKDGIAAALYVEGLAEYQSAFLAALLANDDARAGIEAVVRLHLRWMRGHRDLGRFLLAVRETEVIAAAMPELRRRNRAFFAAVKEWFGEHPELPDLAPDLLEPLLLGPAQEFSRHWLAGRAATTPEQAEQVLAAAAWHALTTTEESR
jgi:AcrR family transcriptional regulator